jgi:predicted AAA+ superfamily ATPase
MCAGRVGQVLNLSALGADCGVSHATARRWMSVLEASYVVFRLQPLHRNVTKRLTKSPKLYFFDTGLASHLLGIRDRNDLAYHPLRGALVENWVVTEVLKWRWNRGLQTDLAFYRDARGAELDLVVEKALDPIALEVKASRTAPLDLGARFAAFEALLHSAPIVPRRVERRVVYAGDRRTEIEGIDILPWHDVDLVSWM